MCLGKELTEDQKGGIIAAKKLGHTDSKTAEVVGCSRSSVQRVWKSYESEELSKKRTGRPKTLTESERKLLKRSELAKENLHSRIPRFSPLISESNKAKRLLWARAHENWTVENFKRVVWSDESTYTQFRTSGFGRVWRESSEEFHENCITSTVQKSFGQMFWGCFFWVGMGPLVPLTGRITGAIHREILANYAIPTVKSHVKKIKKNFFFQEDNAPVHTAKIARSFLTSSNIELFPWPAQSPDMNPIENIWSYIEVKIRQRDSQPSSVSQLKQWVKKEWDAVPADYYRNLIKSMPRRIQAVIAAKGGPTKY
ncbi:unnamed protein product [Rhizophagus irregularis]|nr:unnamed protein product [Rhizophagus irregularis]